jgi:hypothetical protein
MDRIVGGVLGLAAGIAVVALSVHKGIGVGDCVLRASVAVVLGYWIGRLVFGSVGRAVVEEAAGVVPPPPGAAEGPKPPSAPGPRPPSPPAPSPKA